jgi:hypothetical protein
MSAPEPTRAELLRVLACVEAVLYGDECECAPCEEHDCVACNATREVDRHFRRGEFAVAHRCPTFEPSATTELHPLRCDKCGKPIPRGETYCQVRTPDGEVPVHHACMGGKPVQS